MITYRLGARQAKELLARGQQLRIAIPEPPGLPYDADPLAFARAALPDVATHIVEAVREELPVEPPSGPGLTGVLGSIQCEPSGLCWLVPAIVATLRPVHCRGRHPNIQWPASAHDERGNRWPRGGDDGDAT